MRKLSKPRWAKYLDSKGIQEKYLELIKNITQNYKKQKQISTIKGGEFSIVDVMSNKEHGVDVRKIPRLNASPKKDSDNSDLIRHARSNYLSMANVAKEFPENIVATYKKPEPVGDKVIAHYEYAFGEHPKDTSVIPKYVIDGIRDNYPNATDFRPENIIGNKIVDFEPHGIPRTLSASNTPRNDSYSRILALRPTKS